MKQAGIIGAGPSGCICAYHLLNAGIETTLFDYGEPLRTLLPTGGGRCNLAHAEYDFKELAHNYPRGEKFLYSVFSKFSTADTIALFNDIGIETYTQDNGRIYPVSNSSSDVRAKILNSIKNANIIKEKVLSLKQLENGYQLNTNKASYFFTDVVIAIGGGKFIEGINHTIVPFKPSLVGLNADINAPAGVVIKNVIAKELNIAEDLLFTHFGISGPLVFQISSIYARKEIPYILHFDFCNQDFDLQDMLNNNPHKELKNILSQIFPRSFSEFIAGQYANQKGHTINGNIRDFILNRIHNFEIKITGTNKGEETVTCGGYDLKEINPKTMESMLNPNLYIIGEALDIDGFCGGFNLQNAWSTAYVAATGIIQKK